MKLIFLRLIIIIILLFLYWFLYPWYTISYHIFNITITIEYIIYLCIFCYLLLEYRLYKKKLQNEFYHFFFWFFILVILISYFLTIIQVFLLEPKDFLLNTTYFKIQLDYSLGFLLREIHNYFEIMTSLILKKTGNFNMLLPSIYLNEVICCIKNLEELAELQESCMFLCFHVYDQYNKVIQYPLLIQYLFKDQPAFFIFITELLKFAVGLKITCYAIPQLLFKDIPILLLHHIFYNPYRAFVQNILHTTFILEMSPLELLDLYKSFEEWYLKNHNPFKILVNVIKYFFF